MCYEQVSDNPLHVLVLDLQSVSMAMKRKEKEFRGYLANTGAAEEMARVVVGLEEATVKPEDPMAFIRSYLDSEDLPEIVRKQRDGEQPFHTASPFRGRGGTLVTAYLVVPSP